MAVHQSQLSFSCVTDVSNDVINHNAVGDAGDLQSEGVRENAFGLNENTGSLLPPSSLQKQNRTIFAIDVRVN